MNRSNLIYGFLIGLICISRPAIAQDGDIAGDNEGKEKRAWELGIGGSVFQFSRVDFTNFNKGANAYNLGLQLRHNVIGPNLYVARELNSHFYLDVQGTVGLTEQYVNGKDRLKTLYMVGPGLQWRLGEYFNSKHVDPYVRVGVSYMKKNFSMKYQGAEGDLPDEMSWVLENMRNKDGVDRNEMIPVSMGLGVNTWLNDRFGIGLQADYLYMPYKHVANSLQGTARLMWRIGGKSRKAKPVVQRVEVERIVYVDKIVEVPAPPVEKIVEVSPAADPKYVMVCDLFNSIHFEFDKDIIRPESYETIQKIALFLKDNDTKKYLLTGYTDAWGSEIYNIDLSRRRAAAVVSALEKLNIPEGILKSRGVGKKISYAPKSASVEVREGDRKVAVEIISNMDFWNYIPKRDY